MENTPTLETERLILRRFSEADAEALFSLLRAEEVNTFLPMFPLKTIEEAKAFLHEQYLETYQRPTGNRYAICLRSDNIPVGFIKVEADDSFDFGYALKKELWNQGIVTEAGKAVLARLKACHVPYVTATHDIHNPGSGRVMQKLGMTYQYSYEEQWQPKDILVTFRMYQLNLDGQDDRVYRKYWDRYPVHYVEKKESWK